MVRRWPRLAVGGAALLLGTSSIAADDRGTPNAAVSTEHLPRAVVVYEAPKGAVEVALPRSGAIKAGNEFGGLPELRGYLKASSGVARLGHSSVDVVVRADRNAPWSTASWILMAAAQARMPRVHFAVAAADGSGEGVVPTFLPVDRGESKEPRLFPAARTIAVLVSPHVQSFDPRELRERLASMARVSRTIVELEWSDEHVPSVGAVLSVIDVARHAGVHGVVFVGGSNWPSHEPSRGKPDEPAPGSRAWLEAMTADWAPRTPKGVGVRVAGVDLRPAGEDVQALDARPRRAYAVAEADAWSVTDTGSSSEEPLPFEDIGDPVPGGKPDGWEAETFVVDVAPTFAARGDLRVLERAHEPHRVRNAIAGALQWLVAHQASDGRWSSDGFAHICRGEAVAAPSVPDAGQAGHDLGVTGLTLLALHGRGFSVRSEGPLGDAVRRGMHYLLGVQDRDGCFGSRASPKFIYHHILAALAVTEGYALTGSPRLKDASRRGLAFAEACRNPGRAWRYGVRPGDNDTSVTAWMTLLYAIAREIDAYDETQGRSAGLAPSRGAFDGVRTWIESMTDAETGRVGYQHRGGRPARPAEVVDGFPGERSESMTAAGLLCRRLLGETPTTSPVMGRGLALLQATPPAWRDDGSIDLTYWHFSALATQALGGELAPRWEAIVRAALLPHQRQDGDVCGVLGSYDPRDVWGATGGRVYATSMAVLTLLAPVRYRWEAIGR